MAIVFNPFTPPTNSGTAPFNPTLGFAAQSCAPVTIYDVNGNVIAIVTSGGSYTLSSQNFVRTVTFKPGSTGVSHKISFVAAASGTVTPVEDANVSSAVYYNVTTATVMTSPFHLNSGDFVTIEVTPVSAITDCVIVLTGIFDTVAFSNTFPQLGTGNKMYCLNIPDRTVSVNDLTSATFPNITTIALGAYTHGSILYRHINQSVYVFGFGAANTMTIERISTVTDTLVATTTPAVLNISFVPVLACYDWINDKIYIIGGAAATGPIVVYDPATGTVTATPILDLLTYTTMTFMGYADHLEGCFFLGGAIPSIAYKPLSTTTFQGKLTAIRGGVFGCVFNPNNRQFYVTNSFTAVRAYNPSYIPELRQIGNVNIANSGLSIDIARNTIWGCAIAARTIGWIDETAGTTGGFTAAAIGAETGFRAVKYNAFTDKVFVSSRNGSIIRVVDAATRVLDATTPSIAVGNQVTTANNSWNTLCFNQIQVY